MIRIQKDISVAEAMDSILTEYAAVPPSNYKRQLRTQINNVALQDEGFCNAFERVIEDEFFGIPRLDEIEDLIDGMPQSLKDILDQYGILETAKMFAKEDSWCGHEMTPKQKELCETVWESVTKWMNVPIPDGCDITLTMEDSYEHETGKSCVKNYDTDGYTKEFEDWATEIIAKAVVEAGCETQREVADYIRKVCPVLQG